jgi:Peptidoglycan-binding protein, CsiV
MKSHLPRVVTGIVLAIALGQASAQAPAPPPAGEPTAAGPPLYRVEIIAFAYRDFNAGEELFDHEQRKPAPLEDLLPQEVPSYDSLDSLDSPVTRPVPGTVPSPIPAPPAAPVPGAANDAGPPPADAAATPDRGAFRFRLLEPEEYQLDADYQTIERVAAYVPLLHVGWVQPGLPDEDSPPLDLSMLGSLNPSGTIRLYLSRFLHVELDLSYRPSPPATADAPPEPGAPDELAEVPLGPTYWLHAQRNVRSGELHYFDHPAFGVLVMITPAPAETETPAPTGVRPAA